MMIRHFEPNMLLVSDNFYYSILRMIEFIVNGGDEKYLTYIQFCLYEAEELISIFANFIYLEIIELRFCKLDYDLKINIEKRAEMEISILEKNTTQTKSEESSFQDLNKTKSEESSFQDINKTKSLKENN